MTYMKAERVDYIKSKAAAEMESLVAEQAKSAEGISIPPADAVTDKPESPPAKRRNLGSFLKIASRQVSNKDRLTGTVSVRAACHRSMQKNEKPHSLRIVLRDAEPVVMTSSQCSCKAGTAVCNHTVALLFQTAHYSELNIQGVKPGPVNSMIITRPRLNRRMEGGIRSTLYKGVNGHPFDIGLLCIDDHYKDFAIEERPLIATMSISAEKSLVETSFGLAQKGSVLSYQQPILPTKLIKIHMDAPPFPKLPTDIYRLAPTDCVHELTEEENLHLKSLNVTLEIARKIEVATREQAGSSEWHQLRRPRITSSHFREVCFVRGDGSAQSLAERILKGTRQTADMKRGADMEFTAAQEYSKIRNVNYMPCGLIVHPDAPWLGTSPDGLVFDPLAQPPFGLVEIKCPNVTSYVDCKYLNMKEGTLLLKESHSYYWQVQGQLMLTGMKWCDFVICAQEDMLVQRIIVDPEVTKVVREKADRFFFNIYMPKYLTSNRR
ncbi:uncharacterized protein LOC116221807 [Clupea harengus]|uniref:Uncharacterized protein LOC116221807 n=1 Tax=Clupea harengus TaxID=7950 RepID=A0A6P8FLL3_CLUHA|nr:uncharacterized protein LOC116221807 [Clupea harengus]